MTQPLTPVTSPLLDSQDAHVLPERSVQRDGAQTRCTVSQVGLREAGVHRVAPHYMEVTVRDQMALGAATDRCVGAVSGWVSDDQESDAGSL